MNDHKHDADKLDRLLDAGLSEYTQAEPLAGIEDRILARLESAGDAKARWYSAWTMQQWSAALTALVLVAGIGTGIYFVTRPGEDISYYVDGGETMDVKSGTVQPETAPLPPSISQEVIRQAFERRTQPLFVPGLFPLEPTQPAAPPASETNEAVVKTEVFPAPLPLTEQERLALVYARIGRPVEVVRAPAAEIKDIEVAPVAVAPLKVEALADTQ